MSAALDRLKQQNEPEQSQQQLGSPETMRRLERIIAATAKLEARQLWSAAATAMCLVLLPVAVVIAGLWMVIAGLIMGLQWALDVDGSVWLGIGRWLVVGAGLAGAGYGLFASVRWAAGLAETWKGRGMPMWPSWRER